MFELLMEGKEKRDGVPEGGYPETVKLFKRNVDAINKGADAVAPLLADGGFWGDGDSVVESGKL